MTMYAISILPNGCTSYRAIDSDDTLLQGETFSATLPASNMYDAAKYLMDEVQKWLDVTSHVNGYDSIASCISYRGSSIAQWDADAKAASAWRDAVWQAAFNWQQSALANPPSVYPTAQDVISQLPQPGTYGWVVHAPGA